MVVTSIGSWLFAGVFYILPLLLILLTVLLFDANLLVVLALFTWIGIGVFLNAAVMSEAPESAR